MEEILETVGDFLPILIPLVLIQIGLLIVAWVHIFKHENYRYGNRVIWLLVSLISPIGPIIYFLIGKGES